MIEPPAVVARLRRRREFLRAAEGLSERRRCLVVQVRRRPAPAGNTHPAAPANPADPIGAGFTATRKVGGAVIRNRARRRLREAVRRLLPRHGRPGADYVFIARQETADAPWARLLDDMESALLSLARRLDAGETVDRRGPRRVRTDPRTDQGPD